ncbi:MMPL family transporter [Microbacterium sp. X-17]|uniref:MMPL family transporter n=1 Tax=Microbacterium sp. X-17 TaxID=3144404 RepID=UPI0031F52E37
MSSLLYRLGRFAARRRWLVIGIWVVLVIGASLAAGGLGGTLQSTFAIPGTQAQTALDSLQQRFPQLGGASAQVVFVAPQGSGIASDAAVIGKACEGIAAVPQVTGVTCPYPMTASGATPAGNGTPKQVSSDGTMAFAAVQLSVPATSITPALVSSIEAAAEPATAAGLQVAYGGLATEATGVDWTELVGLAIAFVVLAVTFASFVAAGVPLVTALAGVGLASSSILVVAAFAPVSSTAPLLATMLGLAVGIDYALLIVSRHRAQLAAGMAVRESIAVATATAGTAVVFAGLTVMIALIGLSAAGIPFLSVMGLGAAGAVLCALLVAVTLLPAILAVLGRSLRPRVRKKAKAAAPDPARARGWGRLATAAPWVTVVIVAGALGTLAIPAGGLRLTLPDAGYDAPGSPPRVAYDLLDEGFGPGFNGPLLITADISGTLDIQNALNALDGAFGSVPGVAAVSQAFPNQALDLAVITVTPTTSPSSDETVALVRTLRDMAPAFAAKNGFTYQVTGQTALAIDISDRLEEALLPFALIVVGLSLVLLTIMFRSLAVPISAAVGYLFTVAATLGVTRAVFEWGWGANLIGAAKVGPVISFLPILVMAVLFGLAMDYHVFLVSRMREQFVTIGDAHRAVLGGFRASARVVTAAALIMTSVFASFVPGGSAVIQPLAFALAVGVLIDAFVVRMTFIPAVMMLLGRHAWWLPKGLARVLPNADIEGEAVERMLAQRDWRDADPDAATDIIRAHDLRVRDSASLTFAAAPGSLVLVHGEPADTAWILSVLAGRTGGFEGDLAVDGLLLPFDRRTVARRTAYVARRPEQPDASTLGEHLARGLRWSGLRGSALAARTHRAASVFDALVTALADGEPRDRDPGTAVSELEESELWAADVAVALAGGLRLVVIDLGDRILQGGALEVVVAQADADATLVVGTEVPPPPVARTVVVVDASAATPEPEPPVSEPPVPEEVLV